VSFLLLGVLVAIVGQNGFCEDSQIDWQIRRLAFSFSRPGIVGQEGNFRAAEFTMSQMTLDEDHHLT
jgi:hypothetical protein